MINRTPVKPNSTSRAQRRDPIVVARIVNAAWRVRRVLDDWRRGDRGFDEVWFRDHPSRIA